jgi:hypothetical protein
MTIIGEGLAFTKANHGLIASRATATVAADQDLFSIDGGRVLLIGLVGEVTVAIGAGSQDIGLTLDPDDGGANVSIGDTATPLVIDADEVGTFYTLGATIGADMVATLDVCQPFLHSPIVCKPGDLVLDVTGTEAGSVKWDAIWLPLDDGAILTAV